VRDWFAALLEAGQEGLSFAEIKDYLEGLDEHEEYRAWIAAVRASVR
jgi:DNA-binding transcriptional MerR regulator